ncbi:MAG TPA: GDSL-type esterase/lipase family protein [Polyangiaceae bacterium]
MRALWGIWLSWMGVGCVKSPAPSSGAPPPTNPEPPDRPVPRQVEHEWMSLSEWRARHRAQLADPERSHARLVFLGDSITQGWAASAAYRAHFGRYRPLNLGVGGDQTQHVLWRLEDGALAGVHAELVVILIGVNNLSNGHSPAETVRGIQAVVREVERALPSTQLLLLSILPAGETADAPLRRRIVETNRALRVLGSERLRVLDVGGVFLDADERIPVELMGDFLHPSAAGYERLSEAVAPELARRLDAVPAP